LWSAIRYSRDRPAIRQIAATPSGPTPRSTKGMSAFVKMQLISPGTGGSARLALAAPGQLRSNTKLELIGIGFASESPTGDLRSMVSLHRRTVSSGAGLRIVTV